jgi:YebC/PmpR family DNA-binding regulatory protein
MGKDIRRVIIMGRAFEVRKAAMAKTNAAKTKLYSRFGKEIYQAAKNGVPDVESNLNLKRVVERAKKAQVPADIIKRAIDKASSGSAENYSEVVYEGFGPGASTIIVKCLTDNVNRTIADVRNCFTKNKGKLGVPNSVMYNYNAVSMFSFKGLTEDQVIEALLLKEVDINDIEQEDDIITVYGEHTNFYAIKEALEGYKSDIEFEIEENTYLANDYVTLEGEDLDSFKRLLDMLDEVDDVQDVYHNVNV